ncbi:MAG: hypothetical protein HeimC3_48860 [Candidatus Heimdallarchaeota archaeon LC_3]|nr:MAG: hypothetical protein HeimC3_48860 [Candidatus Heimdallarchaeota archaeon LC_3]
MHHNLMNESDSNSPNLICQDCNYSMDIPKHCNAPMQLDGDFLICHMGPECGKNHIPQHHKKPMVLASI